MQEFVTVIGTVGFPIFACCAMAYYVYLKDKMHTQEKADMIDALNRNTEVMVGIKALIESQSK